MTARFALVAIVAMPLGACDSVFATEELREEYETGGVRLREIDWKRWKHWNVHVDVVGAPWTGKTSVYSGRPFEVHACVKDDVLTIYSRDDGYRWAEPSVRVGDRTLEIKVENPDFPVETCDPDGSPVYRKT
jgi:hypothetical protein